MASGSKTVIYAALIGNTGIAITKFVAAGITGSSAMIAEAIHSLVDTGNQVLLLWGLKRGSRPPDERFPFGHGKEVYFWSFVVAILIFAVGAGVSIYEGIKHVIHPHELGDPTVSYIVLTIAIVFEGGALYMAWREFNKARGDLGYFEAIRRGKDPIMFVVLFEDSAAMAGLIVAFVGIYLGHATGIAYFDGGASIVIGLILAAVAVWLAYETKGLLIGEAATPEIQKIIYDIVAQRIGIKGVNELATMHMGPQNILVTVSVDFSDKLTSKDVESAIADMNRQIKNAVPEVRRVFIEAESMSAHNRQKQQGESN